MIAWLQCCNISTGVRNHSSKPRGFKLMSPIVPWSVESLSVRFTLSRAKGLAQRHVPWLSRPIRFWCNSNPERFSNCSTTCLHCLLRINTFVDRKRFTTGWHASWVQIAFWNWGGLNWFRAQREFFSLSPPSSYLSPPYFRGLEY